MKVPEFTPLWPYLGYWRGERDLGEHRRESLCPAPGEASEVCAAVATHLVLFLGVDLVFLFLRALPRIDLRIFGKISSQFLHT